MKTLIFTLLLASLTSNLWAETALRDDGRKVRLNKDGSWEFVSDDVYATSESGLRVVLKADGSWQTLEAPKTDIAQKQIDAETKANSYFTIMSVNIEKAQDSRGAFSKAKVYEVQTLVRLVANKSLTNRQLIPQNFKVKDNKGNDYPVVSASFDQDDNILLIAKGAPDRWSRVKHYQVQIAKEVADSLSPINLQYDYRDVKTDKVTELTE